MSRLASPVLLLSLAACATVDTDEDGPVWELVWQDEFSGDQGDAPAARNWSFDIGRGPNDDGWGNNELQFYTDRTENVAQTGDDTLRITMQREDPGQDQFAGQEWTSARIVTKDKFSFQYGRVEAMIRTPVQTAVWPAFWMLGADIDVNPWPLAGEIDIMEVFGRRGVGSAIHGPGYSGGNNVGFPYLDDDELKGFDEVFHKYEIIWDPEQIVFVIDDQVTGVATPASLPTGQAWVFDHEFYFLLNLAVGGNPVEAVDATTPETASMFVDYIKVFERRRPLVDPDAPTMPGPADTDPTDAEG